MICALALSLLSASPTAPAPGPVFARAEPHIASGNALLLSGDTDGALAAFRAATPQTADQRAIVEYDVGQALVQQAQAQAQAAPEAGGGPPKIDVADARAAFDRAAGLATAPGLKSEAALASGNAAALGGDLDAAIASFRKALSADPHNQRALKNLRRALDAKRAQPPPKEPQDGDKNDDSNDDDKKDKQDKDEQKKDEQNKDEQKKDEQNKDEQNKDEQNKDEQNKDEQNKDEQKKDEPEQQPGEDQQKPTPKQQKKEDAKRLLDALRSREKPLSPLQMRGVSRDRPKDGKDW